MKSLLKHSSINLPDDVFEPGEVRPTRLLKKPAANGTAPIIQKKRNAPTEVCRELMGVIYAVSAPVRWSRTTIGNRVRNSLICIVGPSTTAETTTIIYCCRRLRQHINHLYA